MSEVEWKREYYESGELKEETPWVNGVKRKDLLEPENRLELLILLGLILLGE